MHRAAALATLAALACGKAKAKPPPDAGVRPWMLSLTGVDLEGVTIRFEGEAVPFAGDWTRRVEAADDAPAPEPKALWRGPCGEVELQVRWSSRGTNTVTKTGSFSAPDGRRVRVHVDNRGGQAFVLAVGAWSSPVAEGERGTRSVIVPPGCAELVVRADGEELGALERDPIDVLVDPSGARCYEWQVVDYSPAASGKSSAPVPLAPARLHALPLAVDHLFAPAPRSITIGVDGDRRTSRTSLQATACERPKRRKR